MSFSVLTGCGLAVYTGLMPAEWQDYQQWYQVTPTATTGDPTGMLDDVHAGNNAYRVIYVNAAGEAVNKGEQPFPYPEGTVLVKETFASESAWQNNRSPALTVMLKQAADTSPATGDWEYVNGATGLLRGAEGTRWGEFCGGCHVRAYATDFNFINSQFYETREAQQ